MALFQRGGQEASISPKPGPTRATYSRGESQTAPPQSCWLSLFVMSSGERGFSIDLLPGTWALLSTDL